MFKIILYFEFIFTFQINFEFDMLHPGAGSRMLVKWKSFFKPNILKLSGSDEAEKRYSKSS